MRVLVRHGHFAFYPERAEDVARFNKYFDTELEREGDYYTFPFLVDAPKYSLPGLPYLGLPATVAFEGNPWDIMRENGIVYSISLELAVLKESITISVNPPLTGFYFTAQSPLLQPGSRNAAGQQILSYDAEYMPQTYRLRVSEYQYE